MEVSNAQPILSIVIPTKNRYEYLEILMKALLESNSNDFELVIQDNSDDNLEFLKFIHHYKQDKRLKYSHTSGWLSVVDNCDLGVDAAVGTYVCMLGDDDGILLDMSLTVCKYLIENDYAAAVVNKAQYYWPDTSHAVWGDKLSGKLFYEKYSGDVKKLEPNIALLDVLKEGASKTLKMLPRIYHSFVSLKSLNGLKVKTGSFFPGPSPDMANAVGLVPFISKYIYLDMPAVISGHSSKSTGGQGGQKKHIGKIENQSHLPKNTKDNWNSKIPFFWSGPTIYAESAYQAMKATENMYIEKLSYTSLYAQCLVFEPHFRKLTIIKIKENYSIVIPTAIKVLSLIFYRGFNYIKNSLKYTFDDNKKFEANDIVIAQVKLNEFFKSREIKQISY